MKMIERTILFDLPLTIKGFCFCTPEGEKFVFLTLGLLSKQIKKHSYMSRSIL